MNTLIAVPCMDQVPAQFAQCLSMLEKVDACAVSFNVGSLIYTSRNDLAIRAIKMGADYVFWLDSDMVFSPDILQKMFEIKDKGDIISGLYYRRVPPFSPVLFKTLEIDEKGICTWDDFEEVPDGVFEVAGCGFGCVLMPTDLFIDIQSRFGRMFDPIGGVGEDLSFCWRARQLGFKIICDSSLQLGHVGHHVVTRDYYEAYKKQK